MEELIAEFGLEVLRLYESAVLRLYEGSIEGLLRHLAGGGAHRRIWAMYICAVKRVCSKERV